MSVIDVFTYNDELEMLLVRLVEHHSFVDTFVLIQADRTFTGKPKAFHFPVTDHRLEPFLKKIVIKNISLDSNPKSPWDNELKQRNASFSSFPMEPNDIIYLSDVDEIISRNHWPELLNKIKDQPVLSVWLEMFNFFINFRLNEATWIQPKLLKGSTISESNRTANDYRVDYSLPRTENWCGWHFSYIMPADKIAEKLRSFSHQEFNLALFTDKERIEDQLRKRRDLLKRDLDFQPVEVTDSWPIQMLKDPYWKQFICCTKPRTFSLIDYIDDHLFWFKECLKRTKNNVKKNLKRFLTHQNRT
jgi:beta-1,4-mannosyl-glycoprotein beta-1,4-N-acetylglucosaminyltransferase